jgi:hypothetical protein
MAEDEVVPDAARASEVGDADVVVPEGVDVVAGEPGEAGLQAAVARTAPTASAARACGWGFPKSFTGFLQG